MKTSAAVVESIEAYLSGLHDVVAAVDSSTVVAAPQKCRRCGKETHAIIRAYRGSIHVYSDGAGDILIEKDPDSGPFQVAEVCPDCCKSADSMEGHWLRDKLGTF